MKVINQPCGSHHPRSDVRRIFVLLLSCVIYQSSTYSQTSPLRDWGVHIGIFEPGPFNCIVDVPGVKVGQVTLSEGDSIRTGVTAILPHGDNLFQNKVPGAIYIANGFGKLAGYSQVKELGHIEAPIILTNTLSVSEGIKGGILHTLGQEGNESVRSVNVVVGETNDGRLNDIRGLHVSYQDVLEAIQNASSDKVAQGNVGAGTGTMAFGYKGGIGTSSRRLPKSLGGYTVGVLVQANFGGVLEIAGVPVGKELGEYPFKNALLNPDGSCMIVVLTDAPLLYRNLERLAKRAMLGFGKTGGMSSNGSGDYVIAASTASTIRYPYRADQSTIPSQELRNDAISPLFQAVIEATEEAIINALLMAEDTTGKGGYVAHSIDHQLLKSLLSKYGRITD